MATFTDFATILPTPDSKITESGNTDAGGNAGPGFSNVRFTDERTDDASRVRGGRGIYASRGGHIWKFSISYNPMLRDEFDVVESFLRSKKTFGTPFFVILPQHDGPKDPAFVTFAGANVISVKDAETAGAAEMMVDTGVTFTSFPKQGDYFNIVDGADVNHMKTYKVTRVETNALYQSGTTQPGVAECRLHFDPPLVRDTAADSVLTLIDPKFRVMQVGTTLEYSLNTDNLYQFQVDFEEFLP